MELKLTTIKYERKEIELSKKIKEGLKLEYYHNIYTSNTNISKGVIKKDKKGFYIEWEDTYTITRVDGSQHSNEVLNKCGWLCNY